MDHSVEARIRNIVMELLGVSPDQITRDASFVDDLGVDSLDDVELIMAIEEEFGVTISEDEGIGLTSVGAVIDYLKSKGY